MQMESLGMDISWRAVMFDIANIFADCHRYAVHAEFGDYPRVLVQ